LLKPAKDGGVPFACVVQTGAGLGAGEPNDAYQAVGAEVVPDSQSVWARADIVIAVQAPEASTVPDVATGRVLIGMLAPVNNLDLIRTCVEKSVTTLAFEAVPRITRAQAADALSSMSTVAGYRAALHAAMLCPKFFPMLMTAAGTITPARTLIIGVGVAGLQAIATARRLGAVVEAYDIRPATKEQVLSLGARFVELGDEDADAETAGGYAKAQSTEQQAKQRDLLASHVADADTVITTALAPGKPAPTLIDRATVERMKPGACIIDIAAQAGGNCELTKPDETIVHNGVRIFGPTNLPAELPVHASKMLGANALSLVHEITSGDALTVDLSNDVIGPSCITHGGEVLHNPTREALGLEILQRAEANA